MKITDSDLEQIIQTLFCSDLFHCILFTFFLTSSFWFTFCCYRIKQAKDQEKIWEWRYYAHLTFPVALLLTITAFWSAQWVQSHAIMSEDGAGMLRHLWLIGLFASSFFILFDSECKIFRLN